MSFDVTQHRDFHLILEWSSMCEQGTCRYADATRSAKAPHPEQCPGYFGRIFIEDGQLVARWRLCDRHVAHWRAEAERNRAKREREAAATSGRPKAKPRAWADEDVA